MLLEGDWQSTFWNAFGLLISFLMLLQWERLDKSVEQMVAELAEEPVLEPPLELDAASLETAIHNANFD